MSDDDSGRLVAIILVAVLLIAILGVLGMSLGGWMWGGGMMAFGPLLMLFPLLFIILLIVLVVKAVEGDSSDRQPPPAHVSPSAYAAQIARERYARGEISREEFVRIMEDLGDARYLG
jgi:putative membrane protein